MISCSHLTCVVEAPAGPRRVLDSVNLTIEPGEIVAIVGTPQDGPSALLRALAGLSPPATGHVHVSAVTAPRRSRPGFGYVRAGLTGPGDLLVVEWLRYVADQAGGPHRARTVRVQAAMALVGLGPEAGRRIGLLDRDGAERLAVATLAVAGAEVLLLDGCFAGVGAGARRQIAEAMADLAGQGRALVLAPLDVRAVEDLATRVAVLRDGRLLADLRMAAVRQERVAELRLNGGALADVPRLTAHFPDAARTGTGLDVPLVRGRTLEAVLAVCRAERIPVLGTCVRYRAVDDLLIPARRAPDPARVAALG